MNIMINDVVYDTEQSERLFSARGSSLRINSKWGYIGYYVTKDELFFTVEATGRVNEEYEIVGITEKLTPISREKCYGELLLHHHSGCDVGLKDVREKYFHDIYIDQINQDKIRASKIDDNTADDGSGIQMTLDF